MILFCYFSQKIVDNTRFLERPSNKTLAFVHVSNHCSVVYKFDVACFESRLHSVVADHIHVQVVPQFVHYFEELEHKIILPQVVT